MIIIQATKLAQWMDGKKRKSLLDYIFGDLKISKAQIIGIEFHNLIDQIFHEDNLELIFGPEFILSDASKNGNEIIKLGIDLIEDQTPHLPLNQFERISIAQAAKHGTIYLCNKLSQLGYSSDDLIFDEPFRIEEMVEKRVKPPDKDLDEFYINGKIDLRINDGIWNLIDWKYKPSIESITDQSVYDHQLNIYGFMIGYETFKSEIWFATPVKIVPKIIQSKNYDFLIEEAINYQIELNKVSEHLGEVTSQFENIWLENYEDMMVEVHSSDNQENVVVKQIYNILNNLEFDKNLFSTQCGSCTSYCQFVSVCRKYDKMRDE